MNATPLIALIVNCHNSEKYLPECISSLQNQSYKNLEIICVDNQSNDSTHSILSKFRSDDDRITLLETPDFLSLVEARNFALSHVVPSGKYTYLAFCDSDDRWNSDWLKILISKGAGYDLIFSNGYELFNDELIEVSSCMSTPRYHVFTSPIYLQSCLISLQLFGKHSKPNYLDTRYEMHYDMDFFMSVKTSVSYVHVSDYLFTYRVHEESLSSNNRFARFRERLSLTRKHNLSLIRFFVISLIRLLQPFIQFFRKQK